MVAHRWIVASLGNCARGTRYRSYVHIVGYGWDAGPSAFCRSVPPAKAG
jgi:hypothetical protein